jgi:hypothetical protein
MPRAKTNNPTQQIEEAIASEPDFQFDEVAQQLGISEPDLRDRLEAHLKNPQIHRLDLLPRDHQPVIDQIAKDLEAERSVRVLGEAKSPTPEPPEEQLPPKRGRGGSLTQKKESTNLTNKKAESLKNSDQKSQQLAVSDQQVKLALHARKGQKSGAQLATIELAAEDATYRKIKGEGLTRKVGQLAAELSAESDFDPIQLLEELGIDPNSEILENLRQQIEPTLGKLESATAEIVENAWVNGVNLETEIGNLTNLMNLNESTADC